MFSVPPYGDFHMHAAWWFGFVEATGTIVGMVNPIFAAIQRDDSAGVEAILTANKKALSEKDGFGRQPLHEAARLGRLAVVEVMLKFKPRLDTRDKGWLTAIQHAAVAGHAAVAHRLKAAGAEINTPANKGHTPMHDLLFSGGIRLRPEPLELLLDLGADASVLDQSYARRRSVLHYLPRVFAFAMTHEVRHRLTKRLIAAGADPSAFNEEGETPLHVACQEGDLAVVQALIESGVDPNQPDEDDGTPLFNALLSGNLAVIRYLLKHGADTNAKLSAKAGPLAGHRPVDEAHRLGLRYAGRLLHQHDRTAQAWTDPAPAVGLEIHSAAWFGQTDDVRAIVQDDPQMCMQYATLGMVEALPLHKAVLAGHAEIVRILLAAGTPADAGCRPFSTPAMEDAASYNHAEIVRILLDAGAKVNGRRGDPPLIKAAEMGAAEAVEVLLERGADPNCPDADGRTPLHHALHERINGFGSEQSFARIIDMLKARGGHE